MSVEQAVTTDPRVLPRERCVTRYLLDDLAKTQPEKEFAVFEDGEVWSYEAVRRKVRILAAASPRTASSRVTMSPCGCLMVRKPF